MSQKQPSIKTEDFPQLINSLSHIGQLGDRELDPVRPTSIERDETTGKITIQNSPEEEPLPPNQILDQLKKMPNFHGETLRLTSENIKTVSILGMTALEGISQDQKSPSRTALIGLQRALKNIGQKSALALLRSDLPKRESALALGEFNRKVNPNPRLAHYYAQKEQKAHSDN